jgi:hypothetical protein
VHERCKKGNSFHWADPLCRYAGQRAEDSKRQYLGGPASKRHRCCRARLPSQTFHHMGAGKTENVSRKLCDPRDERLSGSSVVAADERRWVSVTEPFGEGEIVRAKLLYVKRSIVSLSSGNTREAMPLAAPPIRIWYVGQARLSLAVHKRALCSCMIVRRQTW